MSTLKNFIILILIIFFTVYGLKIWKQSMGNNLNLFAALKSIWVKVETIGSSAPEANDGSEEVLKKTDRKPDIPLAIVHEPQNKNMKNREVANQKFMSQREKNDQVKNRKVQAATMKQMESENDKTESGIDPVDAEDLEITEDVFSGLFPIDDETVAEPVSEPMSLEQAAKISDIHQEVWKILQ